jgi:phosphoribosylaminoimidazolecarboxamide formyltransferase / IMP cyclohydrolase
MHVQRALLSVSDKSGIERFAHDLVALGVELIASQGTRAALSAEGIPSIPVSEVTRSPDGFLGGRVKTLQARIHAGILADRRNPSHMEDLKQEGISPIDLVCVNLYPFGRTDQDDTNTRAAIGQIDIGGPTMIHTAALNHTHVAIVVRPSSYDDIIDMMKRNDNSLPEGMLGQLAAQAFTHIASYEAQVSEWFANRFDRQGSLGNA